MIEVKKRVFYVGVQDRISEYFDKLMPLPDGTSYNSYLIEGSEKIALIDTVDPRFTKELLEHIKATGVQRIDYIVANHAEQDHTGALPDVLAAHPKAKVVCNEKCKAFIEAEHHLPGESFITIEDKETISLGDKTLQFMFAPWVHWPETMFTYLQEDKILFTCDLFGAHQSFDELYTDKETITSPAKRYYAEIMMPFAKVVKRYTKQVRTINPTIIAPSHGPLHDNPRTILDLHEHWTNDEPEDRVVIAYVSMHGSTKRMAEHLVWKLKEQGIKATMHDITETEVGAITMDLIGAKTFILASPAYLGGLHPAAANLLFLLNGFKPNIKQFGFISSHGWGDHGGFAQAQEFLHHIKPEPLRTVYVKGHPTKEDFKTIDALVLALRKA